MAIRKRRIQPCSHFLFPNFLVSDGDKSKLKPRTNWREWDAQKNKWVWGSGARLHARLHPGWMAGDGETHTLKSFGRRMQPQPWIGSWILMEEILEFLVFP